MDHAYHAVSVTACLMQEQQQAGFGGITVMTVQVFAGCNGPVPGTHALENIARNAIADKISG